MSDEQEPIFYRNYESGKVYQVVGSCINTTNNVDGQVVITYFPIDSPEFYVKEESEFFAEFEKVIPLDKVKEMVH